MTRSLLLFDLDGTLLDCGGVGADALDMTIYCAVKRTPAVMPDTDGWTDYARFRLALMRNEMDFGRSAIEQLRPKYCADLQRCLDVSNRLRVLVDADQWLGEIVEHGIDVAVATGNCCSAARLKMYSVGLSRHALKIFGGDHAFSRTEIIVDAMDYFARRNGVASRRCYVVGDTPMDIESARMAGAISIAVATGQHSKQELLLCYPDYLLDHIENRNILDIVPHL